MSTPILALCQATCPVHAFGAYLEKHSPGEKLFDGCTASGALAALRSMLETMQVEKFNEYRTHDLRRGHARDMQRAGVVLDMTVRNVHVPRSCMD